MTNDKKRFINAERIKKTRAYRKAKSLGDTYQADPGKLVELITQATQKAQSNVSSRFSDVKQGLFIFLRLLKSYSSGEYRDIPWKSLSMIIACVIYFLTPLDFVPDFLATFGLVDDAALITWTLKFLSEDIAKFEAWEKQQAALSQKSETDTNTEADKKNEQLPSE